MEEAAQIETIPRVGVNARCAQSTATSDQSSGNGDLSMEGVRYVTLRRQWLGVEQWTKWVICHLGIYGTSDIEDSPAGQEENTGE